MFELWSYTDLWHFVKVAVWSEQLVCGGQLVMMLPFLYDTRVSQGKLRPHWDVLGWSGVTITELPGGKESKETEASAQTRYF